MAVKSSQKRKRIHLRIIFGIIMTIIPLLLFGYCLRSYSHVSPGLGIRPLDDFNKAALQINLDSANALANLTVGLAGGLWVLLFTTEKFPKVKHGELIPFVGGSLSLVFSYVSYRMGLSQYVRMLFNARTIDLTAGFVRYWPTWQLVFFGYGFVVSVIALYELYGRVDSND